LIRLANALDKIADSTNRAARLLWFIEEKLPDNILKHMSVSTELIVAAVAKLRNAISAMSQNQIQAAMENCVEVERIEHEADDQKRNLLDSILRAQLQAATLLLCYNLAEALEGVTDKVETASDLINLLAVKAK
jgi:predicted phosphate transport protein (TIGR00153 family)